MPAKFLRAVELCDHVVNWHAGKAAEAEHAKASLNRQASRMMKHV